MSHPNSASSCLWRIPECRRTQIVLVGEILFNPESDGKLIVIDHMGGGSHIIYMIITMIGGVIIILILLFALTADQMAKIKEAMEEYGYVEAHNLDEITSSTLRQTIIPCMDDIKYGTSSTMFLFLSPQYLVKNGGILMDVIPHCHCYSCQTFCPIAIDKVHL